MEMNLPGEGAARCSAGYSSWFAGLRRDPAHTPLRGLVAAAAIAYAYLPSRLTRSRSIMLFAPVVSRCTLCHPVASPHGALRMLATRLLAAFVLVVSLTLSAASGPIDDAIAAYGKEDHLTALRMFRPLAEQENAAAQYYLGRIYGKGEGVSQDQSESLSWYRKAADQGHVRAMTALGIIYSDGPRPNFVEALKWFNLAASRISASEDGQAETRKIAEEGRIEVASRMSPSQITQAQRLAQEWKPR